MNVLLISFIGGLLAIGLAVFTHMSLPEPIRRKLYNRLRGKKEDELL